MPRPKYYSPRIARELIPRLYHAAKHERVPMTTLTSRLLREGLDFREADSCLVREDPPPLSTAAAPRPANT